MDAAVIMAMNDPNLTLQKKTQPMGEILAETTIIIILENHER